MIPVYLKYGAFLAVVLGLFGTGWYVGSMSGKAAVARLQRDQAQITATAVFAERESARAAAITDRQAETQHDQDLEAIPLHIRHDPVFVRVKAACPNLPAAETKTAESHPSSGRTLSGSGDFDIRPAIEAFKVKYETILADCRRLDQEWPR